MGEKTYLLKEVGLIFVRLLQILATPLVFFLMINSFINIADIKKAKLTMAKCIIVTLLIATLASLVSFFIMVITFSIKVIDKNESFNLFNLDIKLGNLIPDNILAPFVTNNLQQILVLAVFIAYALSKIKNKKNIIYKFTQDSAEIFIEMIKIVVMFSPYCLMCFCAWFVGTIKLAEIIKVIEYIESLLIIYAIQYIIFGISIKFIAKLSVRQFYIKSFEYQILAFSSGSSKAILPLVMEICKKKLGISDFKAQFILPIVSSINMTGLSIYLTVSVVFLANLNNINLSIHEHTLIILLSIVLPIGTAGVPFGALVILPVILTYLRIPMDSLILLIAIDPIINGIRTAINVTGDVATIIMIDKMENKMNTNIYFKK